MTILMRVTTLVSVQNVIPGSILTKPSGRYDTGEELIYNPAKIVALYKKGGAWQIHLVENRWFFVADIEGKPDYGVHEKAWLE